MVGAIGIFDSGLGGLQVMRGIVTALPEYDYVYLGDPARAPYGDRPAAEIHAFTCQGVEFLFGQGCELVIIACNTASSEALRAVQQRLMPVRYPEQKVLGVLVPAVEEALEMAGGRPIGVLATRATVASGSFARELDKRGNGVTCVQHPAPRLVPLIEQGLGDSAELRTALDEYLAPLRRAGVETLILGCTHYGIIAPLIAQMAGHGMTLVVCEEAVPKRLADYLRRHPEVAVRLSRGGSRRICATGDTEAFRRHAREMLGLELTVEGVELGPPPEGYFLPLPLEGA